MSFSIVSSDPGVSRLHLEGELDEGTAYVLRLELATLLRSRPKRVDLSIRQTAPFDDGARGLLLSFFQLLQAQGGNLMLCRRNDPPVAVVEPGEMERLLKTSSVPAG